MTGAHRAAGARSAELSSGHAEPADRHGPAARRDEVRRPRSTPTRWGWTRSPSCSSPGEAAVRAVKAGNDIVLHSPDDARGVRRRSRRRWRAGDDPDGAARRVGAAHPARQGAARPAQDAAGRRSTTCRRWSAAARTTRSRSEVSQRSITLIKDDRNQVPLTRAARRAGAVPVGARLSVGLAHRRAEPHVHPRAAEALAERDGDRAVGPHDAVGDRAGARDARRATTRSSCRSSCAPRPPAAAWIWRRRSCGCCRTWRATTERTNAPFVAVFFGNPYVAAFLPQLPAMLLTYDFYDLAEASAVRALAGEAPITREAADHAAATVPGRPRPGAPGSRHTVGSAAIRRRAPT